MKPRTVTFENLPPNRNNLPGSNIHPRFWSAVKQALTFSAQVDEVELNLIKPGWLSVVEIVALACLARTIAESGTKCTLILPGKKQRSQTETLYSFGLPQILTSTPRIYPWQDRIVLTNSLPSEEASISRSEERSTLPILWLDLKSFAIKSPATNLYREEPQFDQRYQDFLYRVLKRSGFVSREATDDFVRGIIRELGWNAVIHSAQGLKWGFAAFAGQINREQNTLDFALVDLGCGISANLNGPYTQAVELGRIPSRWIPPTISEASAIVRYAFDRDATSRTEYPSQSDLFSEHGLALVSEIVRERGSLTLVSSRSAVSVTRQVPETEFVTLDDSEATIGTLIYGDLAGAFERETAVIPDISPFDRPTSGRYETFPAAVFLCRKPRDPLKAIRRLIHRAREQHGTILVDLGYLDRSARFVEQLVGLIFNSRIASEVVVINSLSSRISPTRIARTLSAQSTGFALRLHVVKDNGLVHSSSIEATPGNEQESSRATAAQITLTQLAELQHNANSDFLTTGRQFLGPEFGFFRGNIHLLSGVIADAYFSLVAHNQSPDLSLDKRWKQSFNTLLELAATECSHATPVVLGFASSMRTILNSLPATHRCREKLHCLLSYDVPSRSELMVIVRPGDEVILCTDVISTASLVRELCAVIRRIGAFVTAIIALVDARDPALNSFRGRFDSGATEIPLFVASSMTRNILLSPDSSEKDLWVDPVSAVPMPAEPELTIDPGKIARTVDLMGETRSFRIGHFVDGLRHTSVEIDVKRLLSERDTIKALTLSELKRIQLDHIWDKFAPEVALVPAGVHRIDTLSPGTPHLDEEIPASEIYAGLVADLFETRPRIVLVPRSFEPGGQPKCAAIDYVSQTSQIADVLVVDDGISSGATIRSLMQHSLRAGAKRILIFTLLARTSPEELEQWRLIREIAGRSGASRASVGLINPLHLPIPFAGGIDCAQCATLKALGSRKWAIEQGFDGIKADLEPSHTYLPSGEAFEFNNAWLRLHTLAESSSWSSQALEELRAQLSVLLNAKGPDRYQREAALRLFLVEWRLLGKSRLRQIIRPIVRNLALEQLSDQETDPRRLAEALSVVRSLFPEEYESAALASLDAILASSHSLERVIFHVESFAGNAAGGLPLRLIRKLIEAIELASHFPKGVRDTCLVSLERIEEFSLGNSSDLDIGRRILELEACLNSSDIAHYVRGTLEEVTRIAPSRLEEIQRTGYFGPLAGQIETTVIPTLEKRLLTLLKGTDGLISDQLGELSLRDPVPNSFSMLGAYGTSYCISTAMEHLYNACIALHNGTQLQGALRTAQSQASDVVAFLFLDDSVLRKVLQSVTCLSIAEILSILESSISGVVPHENISSATLLDASDPTSGFDGARVLASRNMILRFVALIKGNLDKHVFRKGYSSTDVRIRLSAGAFSEGGQHRMVFRVENTGPRVGAEMRPGWQSRQFNKLLKNVGGSFSAAGPGVDTFACMSTLVLNHLKDANT